jgi:hypothetical protein
VRSGTRSLNRRSPFTHATALIVSVSRVAHSQLVLWCQTTRSGCRGRRPGSSRASPIASAQSVEGSALTAGARPISEGSEDVSDGDRNGTRSLSAYYGPNRSRVFVTPRILRWDGPVSSVKPLFNSLCRSLKRSRLSLKLVSIRLQLIRCLIVRHSCRMQARLQRLVPQSVGSIVVVGQFNHGPQPPRQ